MTKFKIKETYLLMLIVVGLVSLGIYTTYAMFTASTTLNDVVGITTALDVGKGLTEYEVVTVNSGETKLIELNIVNSYSSSIYYGAWYQIVQGNSSDIDIGLYTEKNSNPSSGSLATNGSINLLVGVTNNGTSSITVYIGAKGSLTNELNLGNNKTLLPSGFTEVLPNLDVSGANLPDLVDGLIPVVYKGSNWVKADSTNSNSTYQWYDYDNKLWANAVLVTNTNRSTYQNASAGTTVVESDILAFYVWIPRYKYKVWNISKQAGGESTYAYNAYSKGIDIIFESEKESTGTINCTYNYDVDSANGGIDLSTTTAETCTGSNGQYYTHPAFTFGGDELRGFWMGKFELSSSNSEAENGGGSVTDLTVRILPNITSWRNNTISNFSMVIQNMQGSNNVYGLSTSKLNTDSHMITNYEWGAVAYLTNSKYGRCTGIKCIEVTLNNCSEFITGIGANTVSASNSSTTCSTAANRYNGAKGVLASTTGNITGVYDMSGGAYEFVMSNVSNDATKYTFTSAGSNFESNWYTTETFKYLTTYAYDTELNSQRAYNRTRLGDATGEVVLLTDNNHGAWYNDFSIFSSQSLGPYYWLDRGGAMGGNTSAGLFGFNSNAGAGTVGTSTRATLVSLSS